LFRIVLVNLNFMITKKLEKQKLLKESEGERIRGIRGIKGFREERRRDQSDSMSGFLALTKG